MSNRMLIDASHREEIRVVVTRNNRIEEFDFESEHKKQLKGNIYLAKVTRVEPALQAAFVEFSNGRPGFLAFSEIHPDYYQIPVADRLALLEAEEEQTTQQDFVPEQTEEDNFFALQEKNIDRTESNEKKTDIDEMLQEGFNVKEKDIEPMSSPEDLSEELSQYKFSQKRYKIQEVIKKRQILLVQVIKEERNNKGAALTTYLSLAGRYSVLMPNNARGGGISRKITNLVDRRRLREILDELEVPRGMGIILRTAGANQTKTEIKRDYEYLIRLWENIRELTLKSVAPTLVYEEGNLVRRSIRDLYKKDINEIFVSGETAYQEAKDFMRMLMPDRTNVVQPYRDKLPIFSRNGIETQLDRMLYPEVALKSGGYIVINQTEALVSIDVNSGRAIREHTIEETALRTNLEAAEEVARQLRLRDLAGLVVIDFIDMIDKRNIRSVEKRLRDCLKEDRARIQIGRISFFGLMEMSRQRIRSSVLESIMQPCLHCSGSGYVRSDSSLALHTLRAIEEYLLRNRGHSIIVRVPVRTAFYILNRKRHVLSDLEDQFALSIELQACDTLGDQPVSIHRGEASIRTSPVYSSSPPSLAAAMAEDDTLLIEETILPSDFKVAINQKYNRKVIENEKDSNPVDKSDSDEERKKQRRVRRGRGGRRGFEFDNQSPKQAEFIDSFVTESSIKEPQSLSDFGTVSENLDIALDEINAESAQKKTVKEDPLKKKKTAKIVNENSHKNEKNSTDEQKKRDPSSLKIKRAKNTKADSSKNTESIEKKPKRSRQLKAKETLESSISEDSPNFPLKDESKEKNPTKRKNLKPAKSIKKLQVSPRGRKNVKKSEDSIAKTDTDAKNEISSVVEDVQLKKEPSTPPPKPTDTPKSKKIGWWQRKGFF